MKFLLILVAIVVIYFLVARKPVPPPLSAVPATPPPGAEISAALKRPLDKTHDALEKVKKRNGDGEF